MLDIKRIREDFEGVKADVERRGKGDFGIGAVKELDEKRRTVLAEVEVMKSKQNAASREVPKLKKEGKDTTALFAEMKELSATIKELDAQVSEIEAD
ncbi:MAG: serine--tRNA ligase, partial [Clostridiales bacterium]|nr:serine--tRNA ligase [Candidatus Crickella merdequi]